jgi:hypothetical protein
MYSHEARPVDTVLQLDVFVPNAAPVTVTGQVIWFKVLGKTAPAHFDMGLAFVGLSSRALDVMLPLLGPEGES